MKHLVIYIPGLGDHYDVVRRFFLFFWRIYGVKTQLVSMQWYDGRPYEEKYERVEAAIENAQAEGYLVSLIGESAGASMAMNVFARRDSLHRMISLCGVNNYNTPISPRILKRGPAFKSSVELLNDSQTTALASRAARVVSVTALRDLVVSVEKNRMPGVRHVTVWSLGHLTTILLCLSAYSWLLIREIRRG
jgi:hypothetical protein